MWWIIVVIIILHAQVAVLQSTNLSAPATSHYPSNDLSKEQLALEDPTITSSGVSKLIECSNVGAVPSLTCDEIRKERIRIQKAKYRAHQRLRDEEGYLRSQREKAKQFRERKKAQEGEAFLMKERERFKRWRDRILGRNLSSNGVRVFDPHSEEGIRLARHRDACRKATARYRARQMALDPDGFRKRRREYNRRHRAQRLAFERANTLDHDASDKLWLDLNSSPTWESIRDCVDLNSTPLM